MHISHDFIATKTCSSYEFLVVFVQVRVWDRKSAVRARVGMVCGGGCRLQVCGCGKKFSNSCGAGLNFAGAGRARTKNFNPRRTL